MTVAGGAFAIDLRGVAFWYGRQVALSGIDLQLGQGVLAVLGPNGAGKTTLLNLLATLAMPSSGQIRLLGRDPRRRSERQEIRRQLGYLPQDFGVFPAFTVAEFVEYFALLRGVPAGRLNRAVPEALERVGLRPLSRLPLRTLSGGQLRRVGIAQAIVNDPALLILDEPAAGLDPEQRVLFRALIQELGRRRAVVVSTHVVQDVSHTCDQVVVLASGSIRFFGTPEQLAAAGTPEDPGDTPLERGYSAVVRAEDRAHAR